MCLNYSEGMLLGTVLYLILEQHYLLQVHYKLCDLEQEEGSWDIKRTGSQNHRMAEVGRDL